MDMEKAIFCVEKAGNCEHDHGTFNFVAFEKLFCLTEGNGDCVKVKDGPTTGPMIMQDYVIPIGPYATDQALGDETTLGKLAKLLMIMKTTIANVGFLCPRGPIYCSEANKLRSQLGFGVEQKDFLLGAWAKNGKDPNVMLGLLCEAEKLFFDSSVRKDKKRYTTGDSNVLIGNRVIDKTLLDGLVDEALINWMDLLAVVRKWPWANDIEIFAEFKIERFSKSYVTFVRVGATPRNGRHVATKKFYWEHCSCENDKRSVRYECVKAIME